LPKETKRKEKEKKKKQENKMILQVGYVLTAIRLISLK
jgi:hypothetical protein